MTTLLTINQNQTIAQDSYLWLQEENLSQHLTELESDRCKLTIALNCLDENSWEDDDEELDDIDCLLF